MGIIMVYLIRTSVSWYLIPTIVVMCMYRSKKPSGKLTVCELEITMFNREFIYKQTMFHSYVILLESMISLSLYIYISHIYI